MTSKKSKFDISRVIPPDLQKLLEKTDPKVFQIGNYNIWSLYNPAVLFANSIIIEGTTGVIVIDTGVTREAGKYIKNKIEELTSKPVTTIVYSHHHYDHINGTEAIVRKEQVENGEIQIIAAKNFIQEHTSENIVVGPAMAARASYGYGIHLESEDEKDFIIGGMMAKASFGKTAHIKPNVFVDGSLEIELHGEKCHFFQTGGEAASEMVLYLPEKKILFCADEVYPSNPNLHSLRGTKPRDINKWIQAIDKMRTLDIEHLVGSHGEPITGKEKIQQILVNYRDIIQFQHDQTINLINKGYTLSELTEQLSELPDYLNFPPYSTNFYGHIKHNIPEFFVGYVSWFSGDPVDLDPTPGKQKAEKMIALMGGAENLFSAAKKAFEENDLQFAAELTTLLIKIDKENMDARLLKAACFRKLGYQQSNAWWRSWYLTSALELEGKIDIPQITKNRQETLRSIEFISALTVEQIYTRFRYSVDAAKAKDVHIIIGFDFTDTKQKFAFELRNSILEFRQQIPKNVDAILELKRATLNSVMAGEETIASAVIKRKVKIHGKRKKLQEFFKYIDRDFTPIYLTLR